MEILPGSTSKLVVKRTLLVVVLALESQLNFRSLIIPFSIWLLQDYLVFFVSLLLPPTPRPLEMLTADFQGPSSLQLAGNLLPFGLNSRTSQCPLLHTQTGSEDLIAVGESSEKVFVFHESPCFGVCVCVPHVPLDM